MRATIHPPRPLVVLAFFALLAICAPLMAVHIEAVRGKRYGLTKRHGPWMIMVASFNTPPEYERTEGMSPREAADQLVYELRLKGIPAYTFAQQEQDATLTTVDRRTNEERAAKTRSWAGGICVLAGNYPTSNDKVAQRTLKFIKAFQPEFLRDVTAQGEAGPGELIKRTKSGGVYRVTPNRRFPFSGAFMTVNPELTEEDLALRKHDPFILRLNSGSDYSLLTNPGQYTVVVATFQGKAELTSEATEKKVQPISSSLSEAADRAWQLCTALRRAKSYGYDRDFDAWVFHDRYTSIVTVGSFKSKDDPRIAETQNLFGAKISSIKLDGSPTLGAEAFAIPRKPIAHEDVKTWIFDPFPQIIEVPR